MSASAPTLYENVTVKDLPGSEIEITGEIPTETAHRYRISALKKLQKELEIPGFRKGHVPEDMALAHIGEAALMQEAAEKGISEAYAALVEERSLDVVGRPAVTITKLAPGNPIGFKIVSAVYPEVQLPDYKKLATSEMKKHDDPEAVTATDTELDEEVKKLHAMMRQAAAAGEEAEHQGDGAKGDTKQEEKSEEPDDAFARSLGDFKDLADLKDKIRVGLIANKKQKAHEKRRLALVDALIAKSTLEVPALFVEGELQQLMSSFEERVVRAGMTMEGYLAQAKKTLDDLKKEWHPDALKRAKLQLILNEIAKKEKLYPSEDKIEREVSHMKEHYPEADPRSLRIYIFTQMTNDLVFRFLEGGDVPGGEKGALAE